MKCHRIHRIVPALAVTLLSCCASLSWAGEDPADEPRLGSGKTAPAAKKPSASQQEIMAKRKANAKIKPVDINSAGKEQLKKLPGIGDAEADKIIAGRPYCSKAWLMTNNIIPEGLYMSIKLSIIAKQPFKDSAKNAADLAPQKK